MRREPPALRRGFLAPQRDSDRLADRQDRLIGQALRAEALAARPTTHPVLRRVLWREAWELREQVKSLAQGIPRSWAPRDPAR